MGSLPVPAAGDPLPRNCQTIEVHVGEINQMFNAMDPGAVS